MRNGYDNWKMAFVPAALIALWQVLCRAEGPAGAIALGCVYGILIADGAFLAAGCRGIGASAGSVASILLWNILGAAAISGATLFLAPGLLPAAGTAGEPGMTFLLAIVAGALETVAFEGGPSLTAAAIGALIAYFRLPAVTLSVVRAFGMDAGDGTLMVLLAIAGNLIGARIWNAARSLPRK